MGGRSLKTDSSRRLVVMGTLVGVLTLTSALLLALAPAPLQQPAAASLFALEAPGSLEPIFQTTVPAAPGRWQYIYIRQSKTPSGDALTLLQSGNGGDHFVISNGDGGMDGEIQLTSRWDRQLPALPPAGLATLDDRWISICLIGDLDHSQPTPTQLRRLAQLVGALQTRHRIEPHNILMVSGLDTPVAIGRHFPLEHFRQQLVP
jgi:hypothetical protein